MVFYYYTFSPDDNFLGARPGSPPPFFLRSPPGSPPTRGGCIGSVFGGIRIGNPEISHSPRITQRSTENQTRVGGAEGSKRQGSTGRQNHKVPLSSTSEQQGNRTGLMPSASSQAKDRVAPPAPTMGSSRGLLVRDGDKMKQNQPEEPLRKVMYFSCWGPN